VESRLLRLRDLLDDAEPQLASREAGVSVDTWVRWLLAACSLGAAAIHFAYAPSHLAQYWLYGVFFIAWAWSQLAWSVGIVLRSWRWLLRAALGLWRAATRMWRATACRWFAGPRRGL